VVADGLQGEVVEGGVRSGRIGGKHEVQVSWGGRSQYDRSC
jgi:hypothetical protein